MSEATTSPMAKTETGALAAQTLLGEAGFDSERLRDATGEAAMAGVDFADLYLEKSASESWALDEGRIDSGSFAQRQGMSLRAVRGEASLFATAALINRNSLDSIRSVIAAGKGQLGAETKQVHLPDATDEVKARYPAANPLDFDDSARIAILRQIDDLARGRDNRVHNVMASLTLARKIVMVVRSDGALHTDVRPMYGLRVSVVLIDGGKVEVGGAGTGGRTGLEELEQDKIEHLVAEALRLAELKLTAAPAPAGTMPVVMGNGWSGILLHEAVGHGLEGDFNRKRQSAFSGKVGERVAPPGVTVVDDGTVYGRRGSLTCDDEGIPSACNTLIEDGILKGYMQDLVNASLMGTAPTGNGRRESFRHEPMPRMTNTYMLAGTHEPEEIIASVKQGLYCKSFAGGSVDITNGNFNFDVEEAYVIENGKVGRHVKGATVIGNGPVSMTKMSMVANDLELDPGIGTCGKNGQWVPVGVGQPHCKVDEMLVGGTELQPPA